MAMYKTTTKIEATATITFGESELRALDAMTGYGVEAFLKVFYEKLGKAYMQPHEQGLRDLFATIGPPVGEALRETDQIRKTLQKHLLAESNGASSTT